MKIECKDRFVFLEEQGMRDGLQSIATFVPTEKKLSWIKSLVAAGCKRIQVTSFVHPKMVSQMADAEALCRALPVFEDVRFSALVLNQKGLERAISAHMIFLAISLSASDAHSRKNTGMNLGEAKEEFKNNMQFALREQRVVRGGIQCAFGCRYAGNIPSDLVLDLIKFQLDSGISELALADSTGMGHPAQLADLLPKAMELCGSVPISLHLHNTENKGLANVYAGLQAGIRHFDTALGGLGGCPFIPGASGNIATEDTAHMLHQMGYETNISIPEIAEISKDVARETEAMLSGAIFHQI